MPEPTDYQIVEAMRRYGGHFARALAEAAVRADPQNYATLKRAFPELWAEYAHVVQLRADLKNE